MSRRDRRRWNAMLKKVIPYAAKLNAWGKTQPKMPVDPIQAARLFENQTGTKPPVDYSILGHFLKGPKDRPAPAEPMLDELMEKMNKAGETAAGAVSNKVEE